MNNNGNSDNFYALPSSSISPNVSINQVPTLTNIASTQQRINVLQSAATASHGLMPMLVDDQDLLQNVASEANRLSELQRKFLSPQVTRFGTAQCDSELTAHFSNANPTNGNTFKEQHRRHYFAVRQQQRPYCLQQQNSDVMLSPITSQDHKRGETLLGDLSEMSPQEILCAIVNSTSAEPLQTSHADESVMRQRELEVASFLARCLDQQQQPLNSGGQQLFCQLPSSSASSSAVSAGHLSSSIANLSADTNICGNSATFEENGVDMRPNRSYSLSANFALNDLPQKPKQLMISENAALQQIQLLRQLNQQQQSNEYCNALKIVAESGNATFDGQQQILALLRLQQARTQEAFQPYMAQVSSSVAVDQQRQNIILQCLNLLKPQQQQQEDQQLSQAKPKPQLGQPVQNMPQTAEKCAASYSKADHSTATNHLPRPVGRPRTRNLHSNPLVAIKKHSLPVVLSSDQTVGSAVADSDDEDGAKPADLVRQRQVEQLRSSDGMARQRLPCSNESCHTIIKFLMDFNLSPDAEFSKKAIESLIKRLRDKRDELDFFIQSVHKGGSNESNCVTIPRTLDGRLQVAGRKGFPHVVYARIFRWPDLHKNEIKHLSICKAAFDMKCDSVCVNPFHYQRVAITHNLPQYQAHASYQQQIVNIARVPPVDEANLISIKSSSTLPNISGMHITTSAESTSSLNPAQYSLGETINQHATLQPISSALIERSVIEEDQRAKNAIVGQQHQQWLQKILAINELLDKNRENAGMVSIQPVNAVPVPVEEVVIEADAPIEIFGPQDDDNASGNFVDSSAKLSRSMAMETPSVDAKTEGTAEEFTRKFSETLRKEFEIVESTSQCSLDAIAKLIRNANKENDDLVETKMSLNEFLRYFPNTVSLLARLLSESRSNNITPTIEAQKSVALHDKTSRASPELIVVDDKKSTVPENSSKYFVEDFGDSNQLKRKFGNSERREKDANNSLSTISTTAEPWPFRLSSTDEDSQVSSSLQSTALNTPSDGIKPKPFYESMEIDVCQPPPNKRRQLQVEEANLQKAFGLEIDDELNSKASSRESSPSIVAYSTSIIAGLVDEVRALQNDSKFGSKLDPLICVLETCTKKGSRRGMNMLIEAIFENINSRKIILMIDLFNSEAPIFSIFYYEFNELMEKPANFFNASVFCGTMPLPQEKQTLSIGTGKLAARWTPLQTQQIYDCRRRISYGVGMEITNEGEVYVRCLSKCPIYVESHYLDRESMRVNGDASHVVYQQAAIKVYDLWQSFQLMCFWITQKKFLSKGGQSTKKLISYMNQLCKFRISFGHDWGHSKRPCIEATPCWIEVRLQSAHRMLENLLNRPEIAYNFVFNANKSGSSCARDEQTEEILGIRSCQPLSSSA